MKVHAIFIPDLKSDNFLSMDLYAEDIRLALETIKSRGELSDFTWEILEFQSKIGDSKIKRILQKIWLMPKTIGNRVREMSSDNTKVVVHILDHSYGNLSSANYPTFITCHDLANHLMNNTSKSYSRISHLFWKYKVGKMRNCRKIFCISENTRKDVIDILGFNPEDAVLNYYGRDSFYSDPAPGEIDNETVSNISRAIRGKRVVLHCGHNNHRKNIPTLLKAFKLIKEQNPDSILIKVGTTMKDEDPSLVDLANSLGIHEHIIETGLIQKDTLKWIYRNSDLFIFPSIYEGFGRPILEAQASGLPIICANSSCLSEVAGDGALYCQTMNHEEFAKFATDVLKDNDLRSNLISRGTKNINRFTWQQHVISFIDQYREC